MFFVSLCISGRLHATLPDNSPSLKKTMKKIIILSLFISLFSCEKNPTDNTNGKELWIPNPVAVIGDGEVRLNWPNFYTYYKMIIGDEWVEPDKFEIYITTDKSSHFEKLAVLRNDKSYTYTIKNLNNNQPYYFYMTSLKSGYLKRTSDTIMAVPGEKKLSVNLIVKEDNENISSISIGQNHQKIAYVDKNFTWNGGDNCCMAIALFISDYDGSNSELLDTNASDPCWSPDGNKIVFRTEKYRNSGISPAQIALYDYSSKEIVNIINDTLFNYNPVFSDNGEMILYLAAVNGGYYPEIWWMNITTFEKRQLTGIESSGLRSFGRPSWIDNQDYIFHAMDKNYKNQIYRSSINSSQIDKMIDSDWSDFYPIISPDKTKIAFISNRSGSNQVWIYYINNGNYKQITGYNKEDNISEYWDRIEWFDDQNIFFTMHETMLVKQKIE